MFPTFLQLIQMTIRSFLRKLQHHLLREGSIFISLLIFLALIRHISNDFLQKVLHQISFSTYQQAQDIWASSVFLLTCWAMRISFTEQATSRFAQFYNTQSVPLLIFKWFEKFFLPLSALSLVTFFLGAHQGSQKQMLITFFLGLWILYSPQWLRRARGLPFWPHASTLITQLHWRLSQLLRFEATQVLLCFATLLWPWVLESHPKFYQKSLWCWVLGFSYALVILKGMSQALKTSALERIAGLSHHSWMTSFEFSLLLITSFPFTVIYGATGNLQLAVIVVIVPWLVPWILLQLDGERPALVIPSLWLCSLFWTTGILAHPGFLICAFPIRSFGYQSQHDKFYGA